MSHAGARAWWADVEHLREAAERREADERATRRRHLSLASDDARPAEARRERAESHDRTHSREREEPRRRPGSHEREDGAPLRRLPDRSDTSVQARRLRAAEPRRTVQITGRMDAPAVDTTRPAHRTAAARRARPPAPLSARPDRIAM